MVDFFRYLISCEKPQCKKKKTHWHKPRRSLRCVSRYRLQLCRALSYLTAVIRYHLLLLSEMKRYGASFHRRHFEKARRFCLLWISWRQINQSGLYILSLIQWNVRNTQQCLPKDLIILLISNYFKDKWVHLASQANLSMMNMGDDAIRASSHWR